MRERRAWSAKHPIISSAIFSICFSALMVLVFSFLYPHTRWPVPVIALAALLVLSFVGFYIGIRRFP